MHFEDHTLTAMLEGDDAIGVVDPDGWLRLRVSFEAIRPGRGGEEPAAILLAELFEDDVDDEPNYDQWPATRHVVLAGETFITQIESCEAAVRVSLSPDPLEEDTGVEVHVIAPDEWRCETVSAKRPPRELCG